MNENDTLSLILDRAEQTEKLERQLQQSRSREAELHEQISFLEARLATREQQQQGSDEVSPHTEDREISANLKTTTETPEPKELIGDLSSSSTTEDESNLLYAVKLLVRSQSQLNHKFDLFLSRIVNPDSVSVSPLRSTPTTSERKPTTTLKEQDRSLSPHEERINRAIDKIIAHNDQAQTHEDKWYIGVRPLKEIINYQPPITKILKLRKDEITHHHQKHNINQRHNAIHHHRMSYTDFFDFD